MSIDTNEIEKYIFDPNNPRQCKSYNLLLNIAKNNNLKTIEQKFMLLNENFLALAHAVPDSRIELLGGFANVTIACYETYRNWDWFGVIDLPSACDGKP